MPKSNIKYQISNMDNGDLKVAIVHDWLYGGGAELVVEQLHKTFPQAPIYTSYCSDEWRKRLNNKVVTGFLQNWPLRSLRKFIPFLRIWWFTRIDFSGYDLVISSSGAEAKGIKVPEGAVHINYCHAPTHYYWSRYDEYMKHPGFGAFDWLARLGLKILVGPLRKWDYKAAQRPDYIIANSSHTQNAIKKYYARDSTVIHPPVNIERFRSSKIKNQKSKPRHGFVISGRQTPYKRFDLAIEACTKLNLPLKVIGDGPDNPRLRSIADGTVEFLGRAPDEEVERQFASAEALIFPGIDDFGITPIEAMAAGTPVIAYKAGGALDYIVEGKTGTFFTEQTVESLEKALKAFDSSNFASGDIKQHTSRFSKENFNQKLHHYLHNTLQ